MKRRIVVCFAASILGIVQAHGETFTNLVVSAIQNQRSAASFELQTNQIATVVGENISQLAYGAFEKIERVNGQSITNTGFASFMGWKIFGPANVEIAMPAVNAASGWLSARVTFQVTNTIADAGFSVSIPSTAVVIPSDAGGPVSILLESSTDMITWNAALPGTYGTTTTNRFFRVRAVRQ